jgi:hypothetical protein
MKYNLFSDPQPLKDVKIISHLTKCMTEILEYTDDQQLADFVLKSLLATLDPNHPIDKLQIKKIYKTYKKHEKI